MADLTSNKMSNKAGTAKNSKTVASLQRASFSQPYEAKLEGELRHAMKHVAAADDYVAQDSSPTVKVRTDASEANGYKQGERDSNKKQESGTSRIKTKDRKILRRSSRNNAIKDEPVMKHVAAEQMEEANEMEAQKSGAKGKVRVDSSEATDNEQGEEHNNKVKQRNKLTKIKTINQGILRRSPRSKTKEEAVEAIILNPYRTQTAKKCMLEISDMQKGNDADSEMKDSRHSMAVATEQLNVTSWISEQKNPKQSEMSFLEPSKVKVARQAIRKKHKYSKAHEEAKRLVILELAKLRSTVNHESQTSDLGGVLGVKRPQQNDSAKLQYREVEDEPAQAVFNQLLAHKSVKGQETKRQCVNGAANGGSRGKNARQDGSRGRNTEKTQNIQSPYMTHHSPEEIGDISSRKIRVMQSLGLVAPPGSPFRRNGLVQDARLKF